MQSPTTVSYRLPDTLAGWPWPRNINPNHEEVKAESTAWLHSVRAFGPKFQATFDKVDVCLLVSLAYPFVDKALLRIGCDLLALLYAIDEYTDVVQSNEVRLYADMIMDALRNPHKPRPAGEVPLGEMVRQFWERAVKMATPTAQKHFIDAMARFLESVVVEARDRVGDHVRSIDEYIQLRRATVGVDAVYVLYEFGMDMPDDVFLHPAVVDLTNLVTDIVWLDDDMLSYNKEQARGQESHNVLTVVMAELNVDLAGALEWLQKRRATMSEAVIEMWANLPEWDADIRDQVNNYLLGIIGWVRASETFHFESQRYFGKDGVEIQKHRMFTLMPKRAGLGCSLEGNGLQELMV
ncbi:terpenoid synthase [Auriscalpium vulgare]|uniref:Terpenoid synthase n=1 Tax=Auriscalpium vulgare TaxID=40419 RepID=A0ACB8RNC6_9AGAM|nr:terpenoid synthase [Auriscalpium vulgare]